MTQTTHNSRFKKLLGPVLLGSFVLLLPDMANAYVGPGAGLSAIGSFLSLIFAFFVAILGFIWYPIKRLIKGRQSAVLEEDAGPTGETKQQANDNK